MSSAKIEVYIICSFFLNVQFGNVIIYIGFINGKACYKIVNTAHIPLFTIAN